MGWAGYPSAMLSRLRHHAIALRAVCAVLLLMGLVVKPVITLACEVHEAEHLLATGHAQDQHPSGAIPPDEPVPDDGGGWHALIHLGHCCGPATALAVASVVAPLHLVENAPAVPAPARTPEHIPSRALRPPISA